MEFKLHITASFICSLEIYKSLAEVLDKIKKLEATVVKHLPTSSMIK